MASLHRRLVGQTIRLIVVDNDSVDDTLARL
jgi:glycosyltransferase involved in cell wall biosynthesis